MDVMNTLAYDVQARTQEYLQPNPASRARLLTMNTISKVKIFFERSSFEKTWWFVWFKFWVDSLYSGSKLLSGSRIRAKSSQPNLSSTRGLAWRLHGERRPRARRGLNLRLCTHRIRREPSSNVRCEIRTGR